MGGGGGTGWCAKHIKAIMNIGPAFLGVPKAVSNIFSAEAKDVAFVRSMDPGVLDSEILGLQTLEHVMRVCRTWDSIISLIPKGGETIWGNLDWSPEEGDGKMEFQIKESVRYGRIISFGKATSQLPSSQLPNLGSKDFLRTSNPTKFNSLCSEVWTEYDEMSRDGIRKIAENKAYTARTFLDLLRFVAPKMMQRAEAQFSHGIADNLDDPKYAHYKYWSNPLETKLPDAPDMEIYCLYGVGLPTERSYVYKLSPTDRCKSIPFRIDSSAEGSDGGCLKGGNPVQPICIATYVREYRHKPPASLFEGRGVESGAHVDIMGNVALIEDVLRVAAGATGAEMGGDRIYSDIMRMSDRINLRLLACEKRHRWSEGYELISRLIIEDHSWLHCYIGLRRRLRVDIN
ncbi:putative phospholipid:diacylglycerol acyltransferase 2 [Vitis vinifera]|uniref:Putative phospholipid:diacylglycerol acyltransferase 2 n=1 Tax=Vitis vinifera TaxID=29760 RepID=A0A438KG31_VITVI|nr:putative phospholipid:diacylglycerol acyltransferase 2 [Vitis vinifera]